MASPNRISALASVFCWCCWKLSGGCTYTPNVKLHQSTPVLMLPTAETFGGCAYVLHLIWTQVFSPSQHAYLPSSSDPALRYKRKIMNRLICKGRFRGGAKERQWRRAKHLGLSRFNGGNKATHGWQSAFHPGRFFHIDMWCHTARTLQGQWARGWHNMPHDGGISSFTPQTLGGGSVTIDNNNWILERFKWGQVFFLYLAPCRRYRVWLQSLQRNSLKHVLRDYINIIIIQPLTVTVQIRGTKSQLSCTKASFSEKLHREP